MKTRTDWSKKIPSATAKRLGTMQRGELLATLAAVLPVNQGIAYLTGPRHTHNRVSVMQVALGRRVIQAEAGINNLRDVLHVALGVNDDGEFRCIAAVEGEIARMVSEHRAAEAAGSKMSAAEIMAIWSRM